MNIIEIRLNELELARPYVSGEYYYNRVKELKDLINNQTEYCIGVICLSTEDFLRWKADNKLIATDKDTRRTFIIGNTKYFCISRPRDCHGIRFDEIIFTELSGFNEYYNNIIDTIRPTIKVPDKVTEGVIKYGYDSEFYNEFQKLMKYLRFNELPKFYKKWGI